MSEAPTITVLLPVLRARDTLPYALDDILAQQGVRVRLLAVVDTDADGRDDGTLAWLEDRAAREPGLSVLRGPGRGAGAALDLALKATRTPLVSHMEADDRCPPERLITLHGALAARPDLHAVTSRVAQIGQVTDGMARYLAWQNGLLTSRAHAAARFVEIPALHQTGLYRTEVLRRIGGYSPGGSWPPDIDMWLRWFEHDARVEKIPRVLYHWRQHHRQSTRSGALHGLESLRAAKVAALARLFGRAGRTPRTLALVSTGRTLADWARQLEQTDIQMVEPAAWKPGSPWPDAPAGTLVLAAYGREQVRAAAHEAAHAAGVLDPDLWFAA